ncbi:Mediator of RNA polymerase II transcription subunit 13 [Armadillidium vulgare]|nr:Mediator of RNA polymerase II transcription subunit 13 [Armadillidium vulgare]
MLKITFGYDTLVEKVCILKVVETTDLCGIKWRVFPWESSNESDLLEDPVLLSYSRCLSADVLCVWRRTWQGQQQQHHPTPNPSGLDIPGLMPHHATSSAQQQTGHYRHTVKHSPKELWVFWYGDEPDLSSLVSPELTKGEGIQQGSWDWETGLSYECRTILFKALHNLIERCLLTRGFIRLGKWFVQPYEGPEAMLTSKDTHLSFSLSFFVHGESTVCASVDVRQHPPVRRLTKKHLISAQQVSAGVPVILAPYGMKGSLTGVSFKSSEPSSQKLYDEWKQFFPVESARSSSNSSREMGESNMPNFVEVVCGDYKFRYPTCFVLVTDMDIDVFQLTGATVSNSSHTPSSTKETSTTDSAACCTEEDDGQATGGRDASIVCSPFTASTHTLLSPGYLQKGGKGLGWSREKAEGVWQDIVKCPVNQPVSHDGLTPDGTLTPADLAGQWEFGDPATKISCSCSKANGVNSGNLSSGFTGYKGSSIATPGSVQSLRMAGGADGPPPSVESPASVTPSPLPTPRTPHSQPASVNHHDSNMPLLSPHQPPSNTSIGDPPTTPVPSDSVDVKNSTSESFGPKSVSSINQSMSPYPGSVEGPKPNCSGESTNADTTAANCLDGNRINMSTPLPTSGQAMSGANPPHSLAVGLRKPALPGSEYEKHTEGIFPLVSVYDSAKLQACSVHLSQKNDQPLWPPYRATHMAVKFGRSQIKEEIKLENDMNNTLYPSKRFGGSLKRSADPYDFEDDPMLGSCAGGVDSFKIKEEKDDLKAPESVKSQPDPMSPSKKLGNLFTHEGLAPKASDLDDIFDSPMEEYSVQTPPGSNKPIGGPEDTAAVMTTTKTNNVVNNNSKNCTNNMTELTQLAKMYPTPPSLEHNPEHDTVIEDTPINIKQEPLEDGTLSVGGHYSVLPSKEEGFNAELPLVFRPPQVAFFIGSYQYKPLTDLPSKQEKELNTLPSDLVYNPSWQKQQHQHQQQSQQQQLHSQQQQQHQYSSLSDKLPHSHNHSSSSLQSNSNNLPSVGGGSSNAVSSGLVSGTLNKVGMSPISPATSTLDAPLSQRGPGSVGPLSAGPPANYELPSPASNQSSYLNRTLPSVEPAPPPTLQVPEANSLMANIVLQDSSINLFRDHNFDSCTMCVCNNSPKVVGNIKGSDGTIYLPPSHLSSEEEYIVCNCGFSAVVNRRLAYQSGLFYEDEVDITGLHDELINERKKSSFQTLLDIKNSDNPERDLSIIDSVPPFIYELVQSQSLVTLCTPSSVLYRAVSVNYQTRRDMLNLVEYKDGNETAYLALEQSRRDISPHSHLNDVDTHQGSQSKPCVMHKWCYLQFDGPACSQDMVRCMKALQPYLQEAIQKKRSTRLWEPVYNVSGPLTWRQFHRMAVRGTEDMAEPLPIPLLLTGHERDWLSVAPQSIRYWEKMMLEPYSQPRNVAYVIVSPDNEFILKYVRSFFKELSSTYELCRLGRHAPIRRVLRDGIMRVSKRAAGKVANEALDDWFTLLGDSQVFTKLRIRPPEHHRQAPSPMPPPTSSGDSGNSNLNSNSNSGFSQGMSDGDNYQQGPPPSGSTPAGFGPGSSLVEVDEDDSPPPAIMVYLVDPFTVGQDQPDMHRLITIGLLRCYKAMLERLPESMQSHVYVQIVSLESILELARESHDRSKKIDQLKSLAFSVFMQCRRVLTHTSNVKSLTGFGPASVFDSFLRPIKDPSEEKPLNPYPVFSPAFILAPVKESRGRHKEAEEALGDPREKSTVLYCTYCLSEDQKWLIACATDELGELLETVTINIEVPNRTRRKKASSRRHGLKKMMNWILGVMSIGIHPWRLVIGRLGRIGHGELKGWLYLLSRKSLAMASKNLKEMCKQCTFLFSSEAPCILSACLVSLEPDSAFRMMPDMFTPDERFGQNSQNCNLSTPQDATCTHILVFPTSATAQSAQQRFQDEPTFNFGVGENDLFDDAGIDDDIGGGIGMGLSFKDILSMDTVPPQDIDPMEDGSGQQECLSQPGSPTTLGLSGRSSPSQFSGQARSNGVVLVDPEEDAGGSALQQQPLALGYYVSTASTGKLPRWFWSSCPHLESNCPTFLKSALHLNQPAVLQTEEYMHTTTKVHPLDSTCTADVLRFVLEGYNSLSWLVLDPSTQDRRSCLPLHMQVLSHLYNLMASLI